MLLRLFLLLKYPLLERSRENFREVSPGMRRADSVTDVDILGTAPRAVRNGAFGNRALHELNPDYATEKKDISSVISGEGRNLKSFEIN